MEVNGVNRCIGCMQPLTDELCDHCQLEQQSYHTIPRCLLPGTILAKRYILGKVLGQGSFGITYIGWDKVLELPVAIKEYYPSDLVSRDVLRGTDPTVYLYQQMSKQEYQDQLDKFLNEARCLTRFNQLNGIVTVRDFFFENNTAYIVMDYIEGENIKTYVQKKGHMSGETVLTLMKPVMESLAQVHRAGLVHRDISPDNLLFSDYQRLVLIDFGATRLRNVEMTRSMTVVFKKGFSPEEQYRTKGQQGSWSDIYAICATMYFMLTGKVPDDAIQRMVEDSLPSLVDMPDIDLPRKHKETIMKGLNIQAKDRYQRMEELLTELYEIPIKPPIVHTKAKFRNTLIVTVALLLVIIGFLKVFSTNQKKYVDVSMPEITIPELTNIHQITMVSLKNRTKKEALESLDSLNDGHLNIEWKKEYSSSVPKNHIIRQSIKAGTTWLAGQKQTLTLVISLGEDLVTVPNVVNQMNTSAQKSLSKLKLNVKIIWTADEAEQGTVIKQSNSPNEKVKKGTTITLTCSQGKQPKATTKPKDDFAGIIP